MSEHQDTRSPEQIQRDIQQTRTEMSETLDAIRDFRDHYRGRGPEGVPISP